MSAAAQSQKAFTSQLKKVYTFYTGGFVLFVTALAILEQMGLPRAITLSVQHWPAFAVDVEVESVFDQTPGPRAGELLRSR